MTAPRRSSMPPGPCHPDRQLAGSHRVRASDSCCCCCCCCSCCRGALARSAAAAAAAGSAGAAVAELEASPSAPALFAALVIDTLLHGLARDGRWVRGRATRNGLQHPRGAAMQMAVAMMCLQLLTEAQRVFAAGWPDRLRAQQARHGPRSEGLQIAGSPHPRPTIHTVSAAAPALRKV